MDVEQRKVAENNEILDHLEAVHKIISEKCARCSGGSCMGCLFDSIDRGMIPASIDRAMNLMSQVPNERKEIVACGQKRHHRREAKWCEIANQCARNERK